MYSLEIKVTKEILERSKYCGVFDNKRASNCAIALAVRDIFPTACVGLFEIFEKENNPKGFARLPQKACDFISIFDFASVEERPYLPELTFEIEIPDDIIQSIDISEITKTLTNHPNLKLIMPTRSQVLEIVDEGLKQK